jgi:dihydroorotate dehydrogenase (NAD+) catalytic subunit
MGGTRRSGGTPNAPDVVAVGVSAVEAGAQGLTAINTVLGAHIDIRRKCLSLSRGSGGYSGPGIKPIAIHHILQLRRALPETPLIGVGGITRGDDVIEFLMAGCQAVQVGTQFFTSPRIFPETLHYLETWCQAEGIASLSEIIGIIHR